MRPAEFDPSIPSDVWEQTRVGGIDGETGREDPHAVEIAGVVTVRQMPALKSTAGLIPVTSTSTPQRLPQVNQRSRILVRYTSATAGATCVIADNEQNAAVGIGLVLVNGDAPLALNLAGQVWVGSFSAATGNLSFLAELHQG